jgi:hypothetical protein
MTMELELVRDVFEPDCTLGRMFVDNGFLGYTCEDCDRRLEDGGEKIYGETAIPRGRYKVISSWSARMHKTLPELLGVPGFIGIRIHGGNDSADTLGCPLLGSERTDDGVRDCAAVNAHLLALIEEAEAHHEDIWITVR